MDPQEINDAMECARHLQRRCGSDDEDPSLVEGLLETCRSKQHTVAQTLEMNTFDDQTLAAKIHDLTTLNKDLCDAIRLAEDYLKGKKKLAPSRLAPNIQTLVKRKDIFSLICMLRAAEDDKRLDAALALMR
jgi:hypothetical protein